MAAFVYDAEKMNELAGKFDLIIDTSPANSDVGPFVGMLKFNGTYCRVGIPPANDMDFKFAYIPLIFTQKKITGSIVTGTRRMDRMLDLCATELKSYTNDSEERKAKIVQFENVNEIIMDDLLNGRNTTSKSWRYGFEW
mmetsp:Transcript_23979/g.58605  ORF Transcript_23979/g.58605 Transcript_23979/m.58605 type:complete len:139 (-) Transcript_23979:96-512(-)